MEYPNYGKMFLDHFTQRLERARSQMSAAANAGMRDQYAAVIEECEQWIVYSEKLVTIFDKTAELIGLYEDRHFRDAASRDETEVHERSIEIMRATIDAQRETIDTLLGRVAEFDRITTERQARDELRAEMDARRLDMLERIASTTKEENRAMSERMATIAKGGTLDAA